jgi:hypothetical protein
VPSSWTHRDADLVRAFLERDAMLAESADHDLADADQDLEG